jgi:hypothetical protein
MSTTAKICTLDDLKYLQDVTEYYLVGADGEPTAYVDVTDAGDFRSYLCDGCGEEFGNWPDAERHVRVDSAGEGVAA